MNPQTESLSNPNALPARARGDDTLAISLLIACLLGVGWVVVTDATERAKAQHQLQETKALLVK